MFRQVLTVTILSISYVLRCEAQVVSAFQWKWGKTILGDLSECQTLPIQIIAVALADNPNSVGVPPYYMMAFKFGGVPTTTLIGSDATNLSWTVNHAKGSQLLLTVADSVGNVGGIPNTIYNITAGSDQSCIPTQLPTSSLVSIKPNVTDSLTTCQPWGLTLSGGTKPYQVVLAAKGSPVITNVTMGARDDVLTYPNRADPNGFLMASVVDAAGHWGISTNGIPTRGSTDTSCGGENPSSKTTQEIEQEEKDRDIAEKAASRKHSTKESFSS
ncbi:hypothetical protein C8Q75DRAFT_73715 [Abortiporus biennis]|nr:hypothetical protein C8Q75DRAFT_73715 [Abortiporus biennis]